MCSEDSKQEKLLRENGLAFFGAITASVSHELNNVISIINQTAGLLDDLLYGAQDGQQIPSERLQKIADRVTDQSQRGVDIIKRLNTFSHTVDDPIREFEVNGLMENLVKLCTRFADMRKVSLETEFSFEPINITNSPFLVQQAFYLSYRRILGKLNSDETIKISVESAESCVYILLKCAILDLDDDGFDNEYYNLLVKRIGGSLDIFTDPEHTMIKLAIPIDD
jgi:light-regulated signal transduction histidine kinase (bacteriophytochrome)